MSEPRERWILTVDLPADVTIGGRFVDQLLKWLRRVWGVQCLAIQEAAEGKRLRALVHSLADRYARQAEVIEARAERRKTG